MQEEQIREALNAHRQASAAGDANAEHDIYEDDAICDYPYSGERIFGEAIAGFAESSFRQAVGFQCQANVRKRRSLGRGIHNHLSVPSLSAITKSHAWIDKT
jgi:ketosteroid isomerase-like protein